MIRFFFISLWLQTSLIMFYFKSNIIKKHSKPLQHALFKSEIQSLLLERTLRPLFHPVVRMALSINQPGLVPLLFIQSGFLWHSLVAGSCMSQWDCGLGARTGLQRSSRLGWPPVLRRHWQLHRLWNQDLPHDCSKFLLSGIFY